MGKIKYDNTFFSCNGVIKSGKNVNSLSMFIAKYMSVISFTGTYKQQKCWYICLNWYIWKNWQSYRSSLESFPKILKVTEAYGNSHVPHDG